jgi:hypothetical protein
VKAHESLQTPHIVDKITNDLRKLEKIGIIHSFEIALDREIDLNTDLVNYCQGKGGLIYANGVIFVNFGEVGMDNIESVLVQIYYLGGESELIEGVLVHMEDKHATSLFYTVEIDTHSYLPSLISLSDQSQYLSFLNYLQIRWYSKK